MVLPYEKIEYINNKSMVVRFQSAMVSQFCVRSTSKRWFLKTIQVAVKHYSFDAM